MQPMAIPSPGPAILSTRLLRIEGKVQGVGYRFSLRREASRLGLWGWVRNRQDGSVEALVRGPRPATVELCRWARVGPPAARVERVLENDAPPYWAVPFSGFEQRPTS